MTIEFGSPKANSEAINVPALVMRVDAASIRDYLPLSEKIPILMLFVQASDPASEALEKSVTALVQKTAGAMIALVVDAAASPELVQAFELNQIPSAYGLLKGQPAPLFVGNQPIEQIQLVITKVLAVAKENGLTGKAVVKEIEKEPELSPTLSAAYADGQHKGGIGVCGLEFARVEALLQLRQGGAHLRPQSQRARRGRQALAVSAHQVFAQAFAQAAHGIAHRWLGQGQFVCRPRQAALGHHLVKDAQQVQVQGAEVDLIHKFGECITCEIIICMM